MSAVREDFFSVHPVRGRREYTCATCRKPIAKGENQVSVSACTAGRFWGNRYHLPCCPDELLGQAVDSARNEHFFAHASG